MAQNYLSPKMSSYNSLTSVIVAKASHNNINYLYHFSFSSKKSIPIVAQISIRINIDIKILILILNYYLDNLDKRKAWCDNDLIYLYLI